MERVLLPQTIIVLLHLKLQNRFSFKQVGRKYCRVSILCKLIIDLVATNIKFEIKNYEPTSSYTKD